MVIKSSNGNGGGGAGIVSSPSLLSTDDICFVDSNEHSYRSIDRASFKKNLPASKVSQVSKKKKLAAPQPPTPPPTTTITTVSTAKAKQQTSSSTAAKTAAVAAAAGTNSSGKKVSFHTVSVYNVLSRNDYSLDEKAATWFTGDEFAFIRSSALSLAKSMDSMVGIHKTRMVHAEGRGLERVMKHNLKKHSTRRKTLFRQIALLQRDEFRHVTAEDLALLFQSLTHASQLEARSMGRDDEVRARDCYSRDEDFMKVFFQLFGGNAMLCTTTAMSSSSSSPTSTSSNTLELPNPINVNSSNGNIGHDSNRSHRMIPYDTNPSKGMEVKRRFRDEISSRLVAARSIR
jgi:hypothetical protein